MRLISELPIIDSKHSKLIKILNVDKCFAPLSPFIFVQFVFQCHKKVILNCDKQTLMAIFGRDKEFQRALRDPTDHDKKFDDHIVIKLAEMC